MPYKDSNPFQVIIDSDLLKEDNYDDISNIQKFSESVNIEIDINSTNNTENIEKKTSSNGFSIGLIIAIIIPSAFVLIGLFVIAIVWGRAKTSSTRPNLAKKRNDFSSTEINRVANSGN